MDRQRKSDNYLKDIIEISQAYFDRPVEFAHDFFVKYHPTIKSLDRNETELILSIANDQRTTCRSGTGTGKTTGLALSSAWYLFTRPLSLVVVTGPKFQQIKDTFWGEFQRWMLFSPIGPAYLIGADKIRMAFASHLFPGSQADMWAIIARTCAEKQNMAGLHADYSLFLCDEASGIDDGVYEAIEGNLTKRDNKICLTGQPALTRGYFFDSHHRDIDDWRPLHFNSETSEIADKNYCARMKRKYGEHSDIYRVRVLGEFPSGNPEAFIQYELGVSATLRKIAGTGPFELGVDVARFGDDLTTICIRQGNHTFPIKIFSRLDCVQVAARVIDCVREHRRLTDYQGAVKVKVDDTGVGGGVTDILRRHEKSDKLIIVPINFGSSPRDGKYADMASKLWGEFRDQLPYVELPDDDDILLEEITTRRQEPHSGGLIKVESKDRFKSDYDRSPDRADSLILAYAKGGEKKRVWPGFHPWNEKQTRKFQINWKQFLRKNAQVYVTLYQEDDLTTSALASLWDAQEGKLYIFSEVVSPNPRPENIIPRLRRAFDLEFTGLDPKPKIQKFLWYGNQEMFGLTERARNMKGMRAGSMMAYEQPEFGIFLQANLELDLPGAQVIAGSMISQNRIIIHSSCPELVRQVNEWRIENGRPVDEDCGLCKSLCNIISMLHQSGQTRRAMPYLAPYSPQKEYSLKEMDDAWQKGGLTELEAHKAGIYIPRKPRPGLDPINPQN